MLEPDVLRRALGQSIFGRNIVFHEVLGSTNNLAKELGSAGAPEGTLVLTEEQTAGRGRLERRWVSPRYSNLTFSVILRPHMQADQVFALTMVFALAAIDGMEEVCGLNSKIKWPNDVYASGKKLGGILTELSTRGKLVDYVVLGLGLNVNWNPGPAVSNPGETAGLDQTVMYPATSILAETGIEVSREHLLASILKRLEMYYHQVVEADLETFYDRWNRLSVLQGKRVVIDVMGEKISGRVNGTDETGALMIEDEQGLEQRIICGDVSVREVH
jgi:BirA family biotin operon repressor/biotin-[acetyl-CoA-carboxylase] ligase